MFFGSVNAAADRLAEIASDTVQINEIRAAVIVLDTLLERPGSEAEKSA